jgi:hypothetical protein
MKLSCLSILLLATSTLAYKNGIQSSDRHRRTKGVKDDMPKGKGGKGTKGEKGMKGCQTVAIKATSNVVEYVITETATGTTAIFPIYDYYTSEPIGTYTGSATDIFVGGGHAGCAVSGTYNFDFDESLEFPFASQIVSTGSCRGDSNAITGGTGKYACASGYETFLENGGGDGFSASELTICGVCA